MSHPILDDGVPVVLDRPRTLRLDMQALADIHVAHELGDEFDLQRVLGLLQHPRPGTYGVLAWACLRHEDPDLTAERAARLLTIPRIPAFLTALCRAAGIGGEGDREDAAPAGPPEAAPGSAG